MSSRPLIPNQHEYLQNKKVVSIHSEDRDMVKYPSAASFEIELPQDYTNVEGVKLLSWAFPSNYNVFSTVRQNVDLVFKITNAYNPGAPEHGLYSPIQSAIFAGLYANYGNNYFLTIEEGFYNPTQMAMEMQNKMNESVNKYLMKFIITNYPALQSEYTSYAKFVVVYNSVNQKLWFGNTTDAFTMVNIDETVYGTQKKYDDTCSSHKTIPQFVNWGLPAYLGFNRMNVSSSGSVIPPRFYYGDVVQSGDDGFWLIPDTNFPGSIVQYLVVPLKINLMGDAYFYIEID